MQSKSAIPLTRHFYVLNVQYLNSWPGHIYCPKEEETHSSHFMSSWLLLHCLRTETENPNCSLLTELERKLKEGKVKRKCYLIRRGCGDKSRNVPRNH